MRNAEQVFDIIGIGIGPANLSLAALLAPHGQATSHFVDEKPAFLWHGGMLLPTAALQVSYLKDLVTPVDPRSRFSFLAYLCAKKRLYNFLNAEFQRVQRREFNDYLRWVAAQLPNLHFGQMVRRVDYDGAFVVTTDRGTVKSRHLAIAVGNVPEVPACSDGHLGSTVFHSSEFLFRAPSAREKRVIVVGGGQSGAEVVAELLSRGADMPTSLTWLSRRSNFLPLDETHFTNELFTPGHSDWFFGLAASQRAELLGEQKLASQGISPDLLGSLYRRLYEMRFLEGDEITCRLCPGRILKRIEKEGDRWALYCELRSRNVIEKHEADLVILCTGYRRSLPRCFQPLATRVRYLDGEFTFRNDFSVVWDGPIANRIYVQNGAQAARGVADPNLSLLAWRSARIVNSILEEEAYDVSEALQFIDWGASAALPSCVEELV